VVNLAADKAQVLREAFRVLRPGGRFAVSDIVVRGTMPPGVRESMEAWAGCLAGALEEQEFLSLLADSGFVDAGVETTRVYTADDARSVLGDDGAELATADLADGAFASAFVRARKPEVP
jgi:ubiquinone/menaquinone biosynthesis C-methylase UbiE